ncbi:MAG: twin-arginine translocase subunit TatC [Gemmatimonadaceae bacterium]
MTPVPQAEMPFLDHLEELRWRLFKIVLAASVAVIGAFAVLISGKVDVISFLAQPVKPYLKDGALMTTGPSDNFNIIMNASLGLGLILASPVIVWQIWGFLSPAMYKHEKKVVIPVLMGAALLFLAGMALAFYIVLPTTLQFLLQTIKSDSVTSMMTADRYFSFLFGMCIAFGAVFELPIVILLLTAIGILNPTMLGKFRRHAFVACIVAAAIITPGQDPTSLFALTVPLYVLYEVSIVLSIWVYRGRLKREAAAAAMEALG